MRTRARYWFRVEMAGERWTAWACTKRGARVYLALCRASGARLITRGSRHP